MTFSPSPGSSRSRSWQSHWSFQIAEKLHAYTQTYEGGRASTRVKDLVDLALIAELSRLDAVTLQREIESVSTGAERSLPTLPTLAAFGVGAALRAARR